MPTCKERPSKGYRKSGNPPTAGPIRPIASCAAPYSPPRPPMCWAEKRHVQRCAHARPQSRTRPAVELELRSFVWTFLRPLPAWIDANKAPLPPPPVGAAGGVGGGGTPGGGTGGAIEGAGGGGGGASASALKPGATGAGGGGGGGGMVVGTESASAASAAGAGITGLSWTGVDDFDGVLSSMALKGRGGAMVPNKMLASCFALPPPGRSSSSSSDESKSDPAADQSSSASGRTRDLRSNGPGTVKAGLALSCCCASRWKGLVDCDSVFGAVS